jgi:uncharacterized protein (UPF0332 family)
MQIHKIDKEGLIKRTIIKSKQALLVARENIKNEHFEAALNRIYYAIFYIVTALAYKYDFRTSKHSQLKGWFNKKFIHEDKRLIPKLFETYEEAFLYRQKSDYDVLYDPDVKTAKTLISEAKVFINEITKIL